MNEVNRRSGSVDVHIISSGATDDSHAPPSRARSANQIALSLRRRSIAWVLALVIPIALTVILHTFDNRIGFASDLLVYLTGTVVVATIGGLAPALISAISSFLLLNWYFTEPLHTFTIAEPANVFALVVFVIVAGIIGSLVSSAAQRSAEAARARSDAESLAAMAALTGTTKDPLPTMIGQIRLALGVDGVAVFNRNDDGWQVQAADGIVCSLEQAALTVPIDSTNSLAVFGDGPEQHRQRRTQRVFISDHDGARSDTTTWRGATC